MIVTATSRLRPSPAISAGAGPGSDTVITGTLDRLASGSGTTAFRSGVVLQEGQLMPANLGKVRLMIGGVEEPIYIEDLGIRYGDGSVGSFYFEASRSGNSAVPTAAQWNIGTNRATADRTKIGTSFGTAANYKDSHPQGIFTPTKQHMAGCRLFYFSRDLWYSGQAGGQAYDSTFFTKQRTFSDSHWTAFQANNSSGQTNQYDRAFQHWLFFMMTADPEHFKRACAWGIWDREVYYKTISPNYAASATRWESAFLFAAYAFTGESEMRDGLVAMADIAKNAPGNGNIDTYDAEARPWAKKLINICWAHRVGDTSQDWSGLADSFLAADFPGNGWITSGTFTGGYWNRISICPGATNQSISNFMVSMKVRALDFYADTFGDYSGLQAKVEGLCDYLYDTQRRLSDVTPNLNYYSVDSACGGGVGGAPTTTVDLNGIHAAAFALAGKRYSNATWSAYGETLLETLTFSPNSGDPNGIASSVGPFYAGGKQFNEGFTDSPLVLAARN